MKFTKMHGCGNDYVYVNLFKENIEDASALSRKISDRHFGIGSDGLITIGPSEVADFRMRIYNADGSEAEMCGNGVRCVAKYVYDHKMTTKEVILVETKAGVKELTVYPVNGKAETIRVDMGEPKLAAVDIPINLETEQVIAVPVQLEGRKWDMTCISMGNPHAVMFVDNVSEFPLEQYGPVFESHPMFPNKTNVEFVEVLAEDEIRMRVWERGSNETYACGTGACASAMASILNGYTKDTVKVHLIGGDLLIAYDRESNHVFMTGPATTVFEGNIQ